MPVAEPKLPRVLVNVRNPITKSTLVLVPPVEISDSEDLQQVETLILDQCMQAWQGEPRRDLREIKDLRGWMRPDAS